MSNPSNEKREHILQASRKLFAENGFENVTMEQIAELAEVGKVTIYRYFRTKDALCFSLLSDIGSEYLAELHACDAAGRNEDGVVDCYARLIAIVQCAMSFFKDRKYLIGLLDWARMESGKSGSQPFPWQPVQDDMFRMLRGVFAEGVARRQFTVNGNDFELAARGLIGLMRYQYLTPAPGPKQNEPERIVGMLVSKVQSATIPTLNAA